MITTEFKNAASTVRIHDDFFEASPDDCLLLLSRIISNSYKRRQLSRSDGANPVGIVAANAAEKVVEL